MNRAFRNCMLAAGAAAFLSSQAAFAAAPVAQQSAAVDPLVSVSVLGTPQSHAAVCGAGQGVASACVVPGTASTAAMGMASLQNGDDPKSISWPLIIGLIVLIIIGALLISGGGDGDGDLTPISPP